MSAACFSPRQKARAKMVDGEKKRTARYREEDYRYAAAKIASISLGLIPPQKLSELTALESTEAVMERISEYGFDSVLAANHGFEAALTAYTAESYDKLLSFCPCTPLARLCRLKYDCNNLKSAIKCTAVGRDAASMMIECGNIPSKTVLEAVDKNNFSAIAELLPNMAKGAAMATDALHKNAGSRQVDSLLDRACFADMREAAAATGLREAVSLMKRRIDGVNIMTALRVLRLRDKDMRRALFDDSVLSGGAISMRALRDATDAKAIAALADASGYSEIAAAVNNVDMSAASLEALSLTLDDAFTDAVRSVTGKQLLGIYPILGYILSLENEIKNLRIILSGIEAGDAKPRIEERLRKA